MNKREFERLGREHMAPLLPGSKAAGEVVLDLQPEGWIRGFLFERTGHPGGRDFYLWVFIQPLFVPATSFVLSLGQRVGALWKLGDREKAIDVAAAAARSEGVPFLDSLRTSEAIAKFLRERLQRQPLDLYSREALAGLLALNGKARETLKVLDALPPSLGAEPAWAISDKERMLQLRDLIAEDPSRAVSQLREIERETLRRLVPETVAASTGTATSR